MAGRTDEIKVKQIYIIYSSVINFLYKTKKWIVLVSAKPITEILYKCHKLYPNKYFFANNDENGTPHESQSLSFLENHLQLV